MSRVITREQTKKLVRGLKKNLNGEREVLKAKSAYLHTDGKGNFRWIVDTEGEVPFSMFKIELPMIVAYEVGREAYLRRKRLGELDDLFYQVINKSSYVEKKAKMEEFNDKVLGKANKNLRYSTLMLLEMGNEYVLSFTLYRVKGSVKFKNSNYQGRNGLDLGKDFLYYVENKGYRVEGMYEDSELGMMAVSVGDSNTKSWNMFVQAAVEFDKMLQTELEKREYTVNIPLIATEFAVIEAENEDEALTYVMNQADNHDLAFRYDPEPQDYWWVDGEDGQYVVNIPLVATEFVKVKAVSKDEALSIVSERVENSEITFEYDPEPQEQWWVDEE